MLPRRRVSGHVVVPERPELAGELEPALVLGACGLDGARAAGLSGWLRIPVVHPVPGGFSGTRVRRSRLRSRARRGRRCWSARSHRCSPTWSRSTRCRAFGSRSPRRVPDPHRSVPGDQNRLGLPRSALERLGIQLPLELGELLPGLCLDSSQPLSSAPSPQAVPDWVGNHAACAAQEARQMNPQAKVRIW